jgi:hypothetical protein
MKRFTSRKISPKEADALIEKYYEGLTTVEEEKKLHQFLSQPSLPAKYYAEQAMFGYFKTRETVEKRQFPMYLRWVAMIAIVFTTVYTFQTIHASQLKSYAIVNGKKTTNQAEIKAIARTSIKEISSTNSEVEESLKAINPNKLVNEQLDVFNNLAN